MYMLVLIERQNQSSCIVGPVIDFSFHVNFNALLYPSQFVGFNVDTSSNDYVSRAKLQKFYTIDLIYKKKKTCGKGYGIYITTRESGLHLQQRMFEICLIIVIINNISLIIFSRGVDAIVLILFLSKVTTRC